MREVYQKAKEYILNNGTDLQKACCNYVTGQEDKKKIAIELGKYQNDDGGWANGLEIEYQGPVSTPFSTSVALGHIVRFKLENSELLKKTLDYLKNTQREDGKWEDVEEMTQYPHPPYMGPGIYPEFKTGMVLKWLLRLKSADKEMIEKAQAYMINHFEEISQRNDFWSAVAYTNVFSHMPHLPESAKIMEWGLKILAPKEEQFGWGQVMGMIEDDMPIPDQFQSDALALIKQCQEQDGGWPHQFGEYNRIWSAIFIIRFLKAKKLLSI